MEGFFWHEFPSISLFESEIHSLLLIRRTGAIGNADIIETYFTRIVACEKAAT